MTREPFSVLIAVYEGDDPDHVRTALRSVFDQTVIPAELVLVTDGSLPPELESVVDDLEDARQDVVEIVSLDPSQGLGQALRTGVEACSHDLVARMDADDVAVSDRFERQLAFLRDAPDVDVLGGYIAEFVGDPDDPERVRSVPIDPDSVESTARFRNPVNHPSVMFRRKSVLEAGNYRSFRRMQDYELWTRMLARGYTFANLPAILVKARAGKDLYRRRGGLEYARTEFGMQRRFYRTGAISLPVFLANVACRIPLRFVPNRIRALIYERALRD